MIHKAIFLLLISLSIILFSCQSGIDAKIEKRDSKCGEVFDAQSVYIVNKSTTKKLKFTIKVTETINDTTNHYNTIFRELEPGDEDFVGCDKKIGEEKFKPIELSISIDTIIYYDSRKYYCTEDTSLLKFDFGDIDLSMFENLFDSNFVKVASSYKSINRFKKNNEAERDLSFIFPHTKKYIGILDNQILIDRDLTEKSMKPTAILKCFDPTVKLKKDDYRYKYEVTGQSDVKEQNVKEKKSQ